jgi:hypothetical protein
VCACLGDHFAKGMQSKEEMKRRLDQLVEQRKKKGSGHEQTPKKPRLKRLHFESDSKLKLTKIEKLPPVCSICLNPLREKVGRLDCGHDFCYVCIEKWIKINSHCPLCKIESFRLIICSKGKMEREITIKKRKRMIDEE